MAIAAAWSELYGSAALPTYPYCLARRENARSAKSALRIARGCAELDTARGYSRWRYSLNVVTRRDDVTVPERPNVLWL
jgi:hypothetical protein